MTGLPLPRRKFEGELGVHIRRIEDELTRLRALAGTGSVDLTDVESRLDALEASLAAITGTKHWFPDMPAASPHASDNSLDTSMSDFTEWDVAGIISPTIDTARGVCKFSMTGNGSVRFAGMYKAIPASEFSVYVEPCFIGQLGGSGAAACVFVAADLDMNPSTADFRTSEVQLASGAPYIQGVARDWSAYNGSGSNVTTGAFGHYPAALRLRVNGSDVASDYSLDRGRSWIFLATQNVGFTIAHVGFAATEVNAGQTTTFLFDNFQIFSGGGSSAIDANFKGQLRNVAQVP